MAPPPDTASTAAAAHRAPAATPPDPDNNVATPRSPKPPDPAPEPPAIRLYRPRYTPTGPACAAANSAQTQVACREPGPAADRWLCALPGHPAALRRTIDDPVAALHQVD